MKAHLNIWCAIRGLATLRQGIRHPRRCEWLTILVRTCCNLGFDNLDSKFTKLASPVIHLLTGLHAQTAGLASNDMGIQCQAYKSPELISGLDVVGSVVRMELCDQTVECLLELKARFAIEVPGILFRTVMIDKRGDYLREYSFLHPVVQGEEGARDGG